MFRELFKMLTADEHYNISPEIEILKGQYAKITNYKDVIKKYKRKKNYK